MDIIAQAWVASSLEIGSDASADGDTGKLEGVWHRKSGYCGEA